MLSKYNDDERKKREEEFDAMFSNNAINNSDYQQRATEFDKIFGGNNIDYQTRANEFDTMFGNKQEEAIGTNSDIDSENEIDLSQYPDLEPGDSVEKMTISLNNNEIEGVPQYDESEESKQIKERYNVIVNGSKLESLKTEQDKQEEEAIKYNKQQANSDKNLFSQFGKMIENFWLGITSGTKEFAKENTKTSYNNQQENELLAGPNPNVPDIVEDEYKYQINKNDLLKQKMEQKVNATGLFKINTNTVTQQSLLKGDTAQSIDNELNQYKDAFGELELNPVTRNLSKSIAQDQNKIATNVNEIDNPIIKKVSELAPSAGNSLAGAGISMVNPYLGMSYFMVSAMGSYEDDGRRRGMSKQDAEAYGSIMGFMEGATEMIGVDKFLSAGSAVRKGSFKEALKNYGLDMVDNAIQESVIDPIDELMAGQIAGSEYQKHDYSTMEGYTELLGEMIKDGIDGALSSLLMNGVGLSIDSSVYLYNKILNNSENITETDVKNAYTDIQNNPNIDVTEAFKSSFEYEKQKLQENNRDTYRFLEFDNEGNIVAVKETIGEKIPLENKQLNIEPIIVNVDGYYNVIDNQSGLKLDTTKYNSVEEAKAGFNEQIKNASQSTINEINQKVNKSKLTIINKMQEMTEDKAAQDMNNITNTFINQQSKQILQPDKVFSTEETKTILSNNNVDTTQIKNRPYLGQEINDIIQTTTEQNTGNLNVEPTNYTNGQQNLVQDDTNKVNGTNNNPSESNFYTGNKKYALKDINKTTGYFKNNKQYKLPDIEEIYNFDMENEDITTYDDKGNETGYIDIVQNGENVKIQQYDNDNNVIKEQIIPSKNGKVSGKAVNEAIKEITTDYDVNRPIKGQIDVEGKIYNEGGTNNAREKQATYNGQKIDRNKKGENIKRERIDGKDNTNIKKKLSESLRNYEKEKRSKLGKDFKATILDKQKQSKNEQVVLNGFKEATGLDIGVFITNKNITEGAFYLDNNIYLKHDSLANKKATNFKPYHEFGHWLKDNKTQQWQNLYNIIDNSITKKQINDYKKVLNDKSVFNNMTEEETKNYIINEIVSDYIGNWANNIENWLPYIEQQKISQEYVEYLAEISEENEENGYNVFGTLEQQDQIYEEITKIMEDLIGNRNKVTENEVQNKENNNPLFSDREDKDIGKYWQVEDSKDLFKGISNFKDLQNKAYQYILNGDNNFETIIDTIDGRNVKFVRVSAREYIYGRSNKKLQEKQYREKMRTAPSIDDLIEHADIKYHSPLTHKNKLFPNGYNNYQGNVGIDNDIFRYIVRVGKTKNNESIFYDVSLELLKQKNETDNKVLGTNKNSSSLKSVSTNNSISQNNQNVKNNTTVNNKDMSKKKNNTNLKYFDRYDVDKEGNYGFYSQLEKTINEKMPNKSNVQQIKGILNSAGIKQDEMKWIGLDDYLNEHSLENISKQQILNYVKSNQINIRTVQKSKKVMLETEIDDSRYKNYVLKGGKNYQEKLYTLNFDRNSNKNIQLVGIDVYKSLHWREDNVIAHTRTQDFKDVKGNKVLFIEEIQSDLHQEGRKKGYETKEISNRRQEIQNKIDTLMKTYSKKYNELIELSKKTFLSKEDQNRYNKLDKTTNKLEDEISNLEMEKYASLPKKKISNVFPFKKNWHEFVLRRLINDAVQQGYDEVAWTNGKQQRERYNLSKAIDEIHYIKDFSNNTYSITTYKDGIENFSKKDIPKNQLQDYVGKDLAIKMINNKNKSEEIIKNLSENINENGNSGMYLFYDKEIPNYLNKYLKKWNSKVETIILENADGKTQSEQMGFKITYEMRNSIKQNGQPLYVDRNDFDNNLNTSNQNYTPEQQEILKKRQEKRKEIAKTIKERSFFTNVYNSNVPNEFKTELAKNREDYQYEPISNQETLDKANQKIENIKNIRDEFLQNDLKSAEDTAVGELLIRKAIEKGDYEEANKLTASLAEKLTTAGQTIQAAAMFKRMTADGMLMFAQRKVNQINDELNKKFKLNEIITGKKAPQIKLTEDKMQFINDLMKQMEELENKKKDIKDGSTMEIADRQEDIIIAKIIAKIGEDIPTTTLDKLASWRNISLLLNTKTITRNLVSNALFSTVENVVDTIGVPIDKAISLITGQRSLLLPNLKTQAKGLKKGLDYAVYDTKAGISTSLGGNKYDIKPTKTFNNEILKKLETISYFGVEGLDRPFMQAKYESALEMIMKLEGLTYGKDIATEEMKQQALDIAKYTTFKDKNAISDFLSNVKRTLNLNKSIGAADVIGLTYTNIPGNLTKKAIDYSPAGLYNVFKNYKDFKNKKMNGETTRQAQRNLVQSTSRVLIGTGIMAVSIQAFLKGILTASGDDEDDKVKALTNQENYAINVSAFLRWITGGDTQKQNGDLYVTYSNYEPLSSIIAAAAEMAGSAKQGDDGFTVAYKGLTTWINTIAELSTLNNFSSLFEYGDLGGTLIRSIAQFPSSFIPTTCKQIAQLFEINSKSSYSDNFVVKNFLNPILQRIPGLSSTLESNYDTMGNEKESYNGSTGIGRLFNVFINTSFTATVDMDGTEQELYDLYLSTGSTDHLPLEVKNYFTYKGQKITLTAEEKAKYQETLGKRTAEELKKEMATSEYKFMTDDEKVKTLKNIISDINTEVRGEVVLEPRGLAYDSTFTPTSSSLSKSGYKLNLSDEMQKEYEQVASDYYNKYAKQGLYSKEKLKDIKEKAKEYAKNYMMNKYKSQLTKSK